MNLRTFADPVTEWAKTSPDAAQAGLSMGRMHPPLETIEAGCRAWWEATLDGKRISTCSWDEWVARAKQDNAPPQYQQSVDDYRRRMAAALIAAVGLP